MNSLSVTSILGCSMLMVVLVSMFTSCSQQPAYASSSDTPYKYSLVCQEVDGRVTRYNSRDNSFSLSDYMYTVYTGATYVEYSVDRCVGTQHI